MNLLYAIAVLTAGDVLLEQHRKVKEFKDQVSCKMFAIRSLENEEIRFSATLGYSKQYEAYIPMFSPLLEDNWTSIYGCSNDDLIRAFDLICNAFSRYYVNELDKDIVRMNDVSRYESVTSELLNRFTTDVIAKITGENFHIVNY